MAATSTIFEEALALVRSSDPSAIDGLAALLERDDRERKDQVNQTKRITKKESPTKEDENSSSSSSCSTVNDAINRRQSPAGSDEKLKRKSATPSTGPAKSARKVDSILKKAQAKRKRKL